MRYYHFSGAGLDPPLRTIVQAADSDRMFKPKGLWLSIGNVWSDWCMGEEWNLRGLRYRQWIRLIRKPEILRIRTFTELRVFHDGYRPVWDAGSAEAARILGPMAVDWPRVAQSYKGVLIAPYIHEARFDEEIRWYYAWDCASGCVWDPTAIAEIGPRENWQSPAEKLAAVE